MRTRFPMLLPIALILVQSCTNDSPAGAIKDSGPPTDTAIPDSADATEPDTADGEDTVLVPDGTPTEDATDTALPPDEGPPPPPSEDLPTWWDCRRALTSSQITPSLTLLCDTLYTAPPDTRQYGIRWVFLMDVGDQQAWIDEKLLLLNTLFEPAVFSFHTRSTITLDNPVVTQATSETQSYLFKDIKSDVAAHLGTDETDTAILFVNFKAHMADVGVHPDALQQLTLNTPWEVQEFHQAMARLRPEEIHVWVVEQVNDTNTTGGMSSPPGSNPTSPRVSIVNIKGGDVGLPAFPHEMGHYFGLKHPHGKSGGNQTEMAFDFQANLEKTPVKSDLIEALKDTLGPELDGEVGEVYVPYDIKGQDSQVLTKARYAIAQLALTHGYMYRNTSEGPQPFASLLDFVDAGVAQEPIFYKNFSQKPGPDQAPNNCYWDDIAEMIACDIGDPTQTFLGTDPMLDATITLEGGQVVNLMSYIAKQLPTTLTNPMVAFTPEQIAVMRVHANTPVRQCLRNHALIESAE
jgi:hypothetical protein